MSFLPEFSSKTVNKMLLSVREMKFIEKRITFLNRTLLYSVFLKEDVTKKIEEQILEYQIRHYLLQEEMLK
jgi:hypothetical protein